MKDVFTDAVATPMKHLSVTKIEQAMKCSLALKYRYVDKIPELEVGKFVPGGAVHSVVEHALKSVGTGHGLPSAKDLDDLFLEKWEAEIAEREHKKTFLGWQWEFPKATLHDWARKLVVYLHGGFLPKVRPWVTDKGPVVEYETKIEHPSEIGPFLVWGYLDLLDHRGILVDWKTSDHVPKSASELGMQLPAYSHEAVRVTGQEVTPARRILFIYGDNPQIKVFPFTIEARHREWFSSQAAEVWKATQANAYVANNSGWWCQKKFCGFWQMCQGELK